MTVKAVGEERMAMVVEGEVEVEGMEEGVVHMVEGGVKMQEIEGVVTVMEEVEEEAEVLEEVEEVEKIIK